MLRAIERKAVPVILSQSAVPVCVAPNGTVATNGAITLGTAIATTYSNGIWLYLPADAVVGGLAGLYWAVMSSTTVGNVTTTFANPASPFVPYIPDEPTLLATGSNAAYTQATGSALTLVNVTLRGGFLGKNGICRTDLRVSVINNANAKTIASRLDGTAVGVANSITTAASGGYLSTFRNRGSYNKQICPSNGNDTSVTAANTFLSIDTSIDKSLTLTGQLAVATDYLVLECFQYETVRG